MDLFHVSVLVAEQPEPVKQPRPSVKQNSIKWKSTTPVSNLMIIGQSPEKQADFISATQDSNDETTPVAESLFSMAHYSQVPDDMQREVEKKMGKVR